MDFGIVAAAFVVTLGLARWFNAPGPGSWALMCAVAVATWRLAREGLQWSDLGLRMPDSLLRTLGWVFVIYTVSALVKVLVVDPLAKVAGWPPLDLSRFSKLPGNLKFLAAILVLVWIQAAFGEEMVFRGFLLTRLELLLGGGLAASVFAVAGQALIFGVGHWYLGLRGVATAALIGLVMGVIYVTNGRNLVPLIIAHGLTDSLSLTAIYARWVPLT